MEEVLIPEEIKKDIATVSEMSKNLVIKSQDERGFISRKLVECKVNIKKLELLFEDSIKTAYDAHKKIVALKNSQIEPYALFEKAAKAANKIWDDKVETERLAEQRRLQAIEDEKTRKEKAKAEAEAAEQRRKEAEARAKAEEARRAAETADKAERERLLKEAQKADLQAVTAQAKAEAKNEEAANTIAQSIEVKAPEKQEGESYRDVWKWRVTNLAEVPRAYLMLNEPMLTKTATAQKGAVPVPGIEFYKDRTLSVRTK